MPIRQDQWARGGDCSRHQGRRGNDLTQHQAVTVQAKMRLKAEAFYQKILAS